MLSKDYKTPELRDDLHLPGLSGKLVIEQSIDELIGKNVISEYDGYIGKKLAHILTGGDLTNGIYRLDEDQILELEREAFMSLIAEKKTQDRIGHMLKTGKALRN